MCMSKPKDPSKELRRQEAARQARVAQGTQQVDNIFAQFGDDFYQNRAKAQQEYYLPQVEDQYKKAYENATYRLANSGGLTSSAGANLLGDLNKSYETSKQRILDEAQAAALGLKSDMAGNRANMISLLNSGNSVESVAGMAKEKANMASAMPTYSTLGDLFAQFSNQIGNSMLAGALTTPNGGAKATGPGGISGNRNAVYTVT